MIAASWWQGMKETVQKCFVKAEFKWIETIGPWTTTYEEDNSEKVDDAWRQLWENTVAARVKTEDNERRARESLTDDGVIELIAVIDGVIASLFQL